ncbi:hypothetical protein ABT269_07425 [Streptomyces viridosporus]|uniref:hypothetical protein n=1 Tax=Streptomyces viridosporus TaxID=67581 RepID=UPI003333D942
MHGWTGRVRRIAAGLGAWAAAAALTVWGASPASAGGPTSVLVVSPGSGETASLHYEDEEYGELERLLGPLGAGTRGKPPEADLISARLITMTWMVHDVQPWRVDQVYPAHDGGAVWIHTAERLTDASDGRWHRAEHPSELRALLGRLGVGGEAPDRGAPSGTHPAPRETEAAGSAGSTGSGRGPGPDAGAAAGTARKAAPAAGDGGGADWWWAVPGAAAGAVLALVLRPYTLRLPLIRRRGEPGPRQELLDV